MRVFFNIWEALFFICFYGCTQGHGGMLLFERSEESEAGMVTGANLFQCLLEVWETIFYWYL